MNIKLNKDILVNKFLTPISKVSEKCVISIFPDHIQTITSTSGGNPILYAKIETNSDIGDNDSINLNIPNVNKLNRMLNCIDSDEIEFTLNSNNIEYKSLNMHFKYHLLADGVITKSPVKVEKIQSMQFNSDFVIDSDKMSDIMKGTSFTQETEKIYFFMKDDKVYAELTDKDVANTDSVSYFVTDEYNGNEIKKPILIDLEIFKMFYGLKQDILAKVDTKKGLMQFKFEGDDYTLQYVVAPYTK